MHYKNILNRGPYSILWCVRSLKWRGKSDVVGGGHVVLLLHNRLGERRIPRIRQLKRLDASPQFRAT